MPRVLLFKVCTAVRSVLKLRQCCLCVGWRLGAFRLRVLIEDYGSAFTAFRGPGKYGLSAQGLEFKGFVSCQLYPQFCDGPDDT